MGSEAPLAPADPPHLRRLRDWGRRRQYPAAAAIFPPSLRPPRPGPVGDLRASRVDSARAGAGDTRSRARGGAGPAPEGACPCRRRRRGAAALGWERPSRRGRGGSCERRLPLAEEERGLGPGDQSATPGSSSSRPVGPGRGAWGGPHLRAPGCGAGGRTCIRSPRAGPGGRPAGPSGRLVHFVQQTCMPCLRGRGGGRASRSFGGRMGPSLHTRKQSHVLRGDLRPE